MSPRISEQKREAQVERILEAARRCFARNGYQSTTLEEISIEAGLSKGGIYTYFATKESIFLALSRKAHAAKLDALRGTYDERDDALQRILAMWHRIIWSWESLEDQTRVSWEFWYHVSRQRDAGLLRVLEKQYDDLARLFRDALEEGIKRGELDASLDVDMVTRVFWVLTDGLVGYWLARNQRPSTAELTRVERVISRLVRRSLPAAGDTAER
ncbi:TetR/AcrR family transcriptional regulator [Limnochorda pilosa]|uniref:HTH tetR-type domain-containing protein n=1 Tax=Limnochorda pilosa TaxID=1555112 RepID=A0A0K2SH34_LIMPI|nr:TetR/AcrR family transcriptional regulator [Limnochorda pilosa]BAS26342.1 hypothetical protein LIP_0485 [Limnochorda pilosa]